MYKVFNIVILVLVVISITYGQVDTISSIQELNVLDRNFFDEFELDIDYIKEKETIYLTVNEDSTVVSGFRLLIRDIHPEGIFTIKVENDKYAIRILSINNGYKFVNESFRNGFRISNNTNLIDVKGFKDWNESQVFVNLLKDFVMSKIERSKSNEEVEIYLPKTKNP